MWPDRNDALSRTIEAERAVEDLYAEALRRWAPTASQYVLPSLTAATLPPDPAAVQQASPTWDQLAEELIIAGVAVLWAATFIEVCGALGIPLPELPNGADGYRQPPRKVLQIVDSAVGGMDRAAVVHAARVVEEIGALRETRNAFLDTQRQEAAKVPGWVQAKVEASIRDAQASNFDVEQIRAEVRDTVDPASEQMREIARTAGHQAAAVQNHAVVTAAAEGEDADELDKVWIATIDGKTRPTHWAADGQRAPLAATFTVGGEQLSFPGDPTGSPAETANCRCRVGVLAHDEELPDEVDRHTERLDGRDSTARNREGSQDDEIQRRADSGNIRAREDPDGIGRVASGGWAAPSEGITNMTSAVDEQTTTLAADNGDQGDEDTYLTFTDALFAVTGVPTSDGRMLASDIALTIRDTPLPLQWCKENEGGHYGSVTVGVIESISHKNGQVLGSGYMLNTPEALEAIEPASHGVTNPSIDLGDYVMVATYEDGTIVTEENYDEERKIYATVTEAELIATTLVATPAFGETRFRLNEQREKREKALVASAAEQFRPRVYDPAMFADPHLSGPTLLTITDDGHIFGHIACFGECHRSIQAECIMAPRSSSGYKHFHSSPGVHLADGTTLPVGRLTVGTGHAPDNLAAGPAIAHYDNTGTCFALVRAGEDAHGIWVSGVAAPWATPEQVEMGLSSPLSGDWRRLDGNLELVAALAVNTPGFLARVTDTNGSPTTLVASLAPSPSVETAGGPPLSLDDIKAAVREGIAEERRQAALAVEREAVLARAREAVGDPPPPKTRSEQIAELLARADA